MYSAVRTMSKKIVVIGGGAAGMMAALSAAEQGAQVKHIASANMPLVRAWMHCNPLSTKLLAIQGHFYHVGYIASSGIAKGGHLININA